MKEFEDLIPECADPNATDYEKRMVYAATLCDYSSGLVNVDPQKAYSLYMKALSIGKEEEEKGNDAYIKVNRGINRVAIYTNPSHIIYDSYYALAQLCESGRLSGTPDYEGAIEYYKLARKYDPTHETYNLYRACQLAGKKEVIVSLAIDTLKEGIETRKKNNGFEFVKGADKTMVHVLERLSRKGRFDDAINLYDEYNRLSRICDSCIFGNGGDENEASKELESFIKGIKI